MKTLMRAGLILAFCIASVTTSLADLLGANTSFPEISYLNVDPFSQNYTASNQLFSLNASPTTILLAPLQTPIRITGTKGLTITIQVDNTGALVGSAPGDGGNDLVLTGTAVIGGNTYTGTLLTGQMIAFGSLPGLTSQYDFRFIPTGGQLASLFCGNISMTLGSENSTFTGDWTVNFNGSSKGIIGSEDLTPPMIKCPPDLIVQAVFTNGMQGAYVTFTNPVVMDNCDSSPTVVFTPPSGSFFPLPPPPANSTNYTISIVVTDASGNTNTCSFNLTVVDTTPPSFTSSNNPVITGTPTNPIVLCNDSNSCYATFVFPIPTATDALGNTDTVGVSAITETGATINLTNLGNGYLQGQFPVNTTGTNYIIVTANDGRGNSSQHITPVLVEDCQPPQIFCTDQTVTFKPILTNALSCITANFNTTCVNSNNYIWFSSVIQNPSCNSRTPFTVHVTGQTIQLCVDNTNITLSVPDAFVTFSNGVAVASTTFTNGDWITITKPGLGGNTFLSGLAWKVPFNLNNNYNVRLPGYCWGKDNFNPCKSRCSVASATWCGRFSVDTAGVVVQWQWGAVVESTLNTNCNLLGVKPCDDSRSSCYNNSDPAGACEKYKTCLTSGACGQGSYWCGYCYQPDCTGTLSQPARANLGMGSICMGAVEFTPPLAVDNCGKAVSVVCTPAPGSLLGPGVYPVTAVATDASGNTNSCTFNLTVIAPLQVVFDCPMNDNLPDNTCQPDVGFSDMNCPDAPSTPQYVTSFTPGCKILHCVRLIDCNGNDVTTQMAPYCTVHIDVTERQGCYTNSVVVNDLPQNYSCIGSPGGIMVPCNGEFEFNLDTTGYPRNTANNSLFFRSCVWVEYHSSPGVPCGMEDVLFESH